MALRGRARANDGVKIFHALINPIDYIFATFIPDTIDEMPILDATSYSDLLTRRWPQAWLEGHAPIGRPVAPDVANKYWPDLQNSISNNKVAYSDAIGGQISNRDYILVSQAKNLIFTLLREAPNSDGVLKEVIEATHYQAKEPKNILFFNPDNIKPPSVLSSQSETPSAPAWAEFVTASSPNLGQLVSTHCSTTENGFT